jgi:hypothetical protein
VLGGKSQSRSCGHKPLFRNLRRAGAEECAYTAVTPLSTTVPGRVLPFLAACGPLVG